MKKTVRWNFTLETLFVLLKCIIFVFLSTNCVCSSTLKEVVLADVPQSAYRMSQCFCISYTWISKLYKFPYLLHKNLSFWRFLRIPRKYLHVSIISCHVFLWIFVSNCPSLFLAISFSSSHAFIVPFCMLCLWKWTQSFPLFSKIVRTQICLRMYR